MICNQKYLYKINLDTGADVARFNRIASHISGKVMLVSGNRRLNAKSFLGVHLARMAWDEIWVECDSDCYFELREFIAE
ncbi:MAG: hypothetical protein J6R82_05155 [Clostridia bacterium]|nr:hypothetical protein [Clostridia bacterium]